MKISSRIEGILSTVFSHEIRSFASCSYQHRYSRHTIRQSDHHLTCQPVTAHDILPMQYHRGQFVQVHLYAFQTEIFLFYFKGNRTRKYTSLLVQIEYLDLWGSVQLTIFVFISPIRINHINSHHHVLCIRMGKAENQVICQPISPTGNTDYCGYRNVIGQKVPNIKGKSICYKK